MLVKLLQKILWLWANYFPGYGTPEKFIYKIQRLHSSDIFYKSVQTSHKDSKLYYLH